MPLSDKWNDGRLEDRLREINRRIDSVQLLAEATDKRLDSVEDLATANNADMGRLAATGDRRLDRKWQIELAIIIGLVSLLSTVSGSIIGHLL